MTTRYRLDLAYDGADFHGWARQDGLRTVQGVLEEWIGTVLRLPAPAALTVAGRTDAGVHARGQVAHVDVPPELVRAAAGRSHEPTLDALRRRLNGILGPDVRILLVTEAAEGFDARFSAVWRRYVYRIADHPRYRVEGAHVTEHVPVTPWEAALGGSVSVPTPDGTVEVTVPAGSQSGRKLRLKGKGIPARTPGDLYIVLDVVLPPANNDKARALYQAMARDLAFNPRAA